MKRAFLASCFSLNLVAAGLLLDTPKAKAVCLTGNLDAVSGQGNGCLTFNPNTQSNAAPDYAYVQYLDGNIPSNKYFQMAFYDANVAPLESTFTITNIEYGYSDPANTVPTSWTPFGTSSVVACDACTSYFTDVLVLGSAPPSNSVPVQRPGRADAAECKHDHSTEHAEMRTVVLPVLRDRATAMASPRRGDRQPTPAPGMARRPGPVVATWW